MQAHGAVDLMGHDKPLPGNYIRWCAGDQQRASTVSQVFMRGKERFDPARSGHTEAVDVDPPTPAAWYSKREVSQGLDADLAQNSDDTGLQPVVDPVADQGDRNGRATELFDGGGHGARGRGAFANRSSEELCEVIAVA